MVGHSSIRITGLAAGVVLLASFCGRLDARRQPQIASGESALSVVFGDTKSVISRSFIEKADSYFHGGIGREPCARHNHAEATDADHPAAESCHAAPDTGHAARGFDPWRWVNARVAAPHVHHHLQDKESVELLPWLWASVKADPHNEEAWEAAWYTAARIMKDDQLAARVLDEGLRCNPKSARLHLTQGEFLYRRGKGDLPAAERSFRKAKELSSADSQIREFAIRYLNDLRNKLNKK